MHVATVDPAVWAALIGLGGSIIGGAILMAWRLGGLSTKVDLLIEQQRTNTNRLDVIDAKADGATSAATSATAAAQAANATATAMAATIQRRRDDPVPGSPR